MQCSFCTISAARHWKQLGCLLAIGLTPVPLPSCALVWVHLSQVHGCIQHDGDNFRVKQRLGCSDSTKAAGTSPPCRAWTNLPPLVQRSTAAPSCTVQSRATTSKRAPFLSIARFQHNQVTLVHCCRCLFFYTGASVRQRQTKSERVQRCTVWFGLTVQCYAS